MTEYDTSQHVASTDMEALAVGPGSLGCEAAKLAAVAAGK